MSNRIDSLMQKVDEPEAEENVEKEFEQKIGVVCGCDRVNLRCASSKVAKVIEIVDAGTEVIIVGEEPGWYEVELNNLHGYIMSIYIKMMES